LTTVVLCSDHQKYFLNTKGDFVVPNFKIIQDQPDQARIKIYGTNNVALNQDSSGNLAVTNMGNPLSITTASGQALAITTLSGQNLAITNAGNPLSITTASGQALAITTLSGQNLAITNAGNPLSITTASGQALAITTLSGQNLAITNAGNPLSITTASGQALAITTLSGQTLDVSQQLSNTAVDYTSGNLASGADALTTARQTVMSYSRWSWIVYNSSSDSTARPVVKMQGSPNGDNWLDNSGLVTLSSAGLTALVPSYFLKYSRVYYSANGTAASLGFYFQAQG